MRFGRCYQEPEVGCLVKVFVIKYGKRVILKKSNLYLGKILIFLQPKERLNVSEFGNNTTPVTKAIIYRFPFWE